MKKVLVFIVAMFLVMATACTDSNNKPVNVDNPENVNVESENGEMVLYYASDDAMGLKAEVRAVPKEKEADPVYAAELLISGAEAEGFVSVIPEGTKLNSCIVEDGICTVDVSEEFISEKGSANEQMVIYSVVNTLCRLEGIDKVKFLVDGKEVAVFGSYVFDEPFSEDTTLIKVGY